MQKESEFEAEPRLSYIEGARDVAVLEAMLESGARQGALVHVKKFWDYHMEFFWLVNWFIIFWVVIICIFKSVLKKPGKP